MSDEELFALLDAVLPGKAFTPLAPAGTLEPYVIYQDLFTHPANSLCGYEELDEVHWQIDIYALTRREAKTIANAVKAALRALPLPPNVDTEQGFYEPETRLYRRMVNIITWNQPEKVTA